MSDVKRKPWMKWYPADWRADPKLRMCSLAARGLWADILSLMHEAEPYGHLLIAGSAPTDKQLATLVGATEREVKAAISELRDAGVFSIGDNGVVYSRRMVRDYAKAKQDRDNGLGGGNPKLKGGVNPPDNPECDVGVKGEDKSSCARHLEARGQISKPSGFERAGAPAKKACRLPEDWRPDETLVEWALFEDRDTGWPGMDSTSLAREAEKFRDYWRGKSGADGRKLDWPATFRNWLRKSVEDGQRSPRLVVRNSGNFL